MTPTRFNLTLAEFSEWLHSDTEHAGELAHGATIADTVTALHSTRAALAQIKTVSSHVRGDMAIYYDRTAATPDRRHYDGRELRWVGGAEGTKKRMVEAATVKKHRYAAWDSARILKPWMVVKNPDIELAPLDALDDLYRTAPGGMPRARDLFRAQEDLSTLRKPLRADEDAQKARLAEIAEITGWDGDVLGFCDGWSVQTTMLRFDGELFAKMYPDLFEELAIEKMTAGTTPHMAFARPTHQGFTGYKMHNNQWTYFHNGEVSEPDEQDGE